MQAIAIYRSSIGKKAIMAVTGAIWIGFVIFHMYGNLKVFGGAAYFNAYSDGLRHVGAPIFGYMHLLTVARIVLLVAFGLHVWAALVLYLQARQARPYKYSTQRVVQANYASRTIRLGGVVILLFLIFHLMDLTWGVPGVNPDFIHGDPYHNLVSSFQSVPVSLFYVLAVVVLGFHLYHGIWSMFQTLGWNNRDWDKLIHGAAVVVAVLVPIGFAVVPISVMLGIVQ